MAVKNGGIVFPDASPLPVVNAPVAERGPFDIPDALRDHARTAVPAECGGLWWTIGEFREGGEFVTAVARRGPNGRLCFGTEGEAA